MKTKLYYFGYAVILPLAVLAGLLNLALGAIYLVIYAPLTWLAGGDPDSSRFRFLDMSPAGAALRVVEDYQDLFSPNELNK